MPTPAEPFIVAEISKNYRDGAEIRPTGPIAKQFESMININWSRGYVLHSFQIDRRMTDDQMNETIIAVFRRRSDADR